MRLLLLLCRRKAALATSDVNVSFQTQTTSQRHLTCPRSATSSPWTSAQQFKDLRAPPPTVFMDEDRCMGTAIHSGKATGGIGNGMFFVVSSSSLRVFRPRPHTLPSDELRMMLIETTWTTHPGLRYRATSSLVPNPAVKTIRKHCHALCHAMHGDERAQMQCNIILASPLHRARSPS